VKSDKDDTDTSGMSTQRKTSLNAHSADNRTCRWCTMDPTWPCQAWHRKTCYSHCPVNTYSIMQFIYINATD